MLFKTLLSSLQSLSRQEIVMAQDISSSGQKTFIKDTLEPLKQLYETCTDKHWYECLVENRPSRIFLDIESTASVDLSYILTKLSDWAKYQSTRFMFQRKTILACHMYQRLPQKRISRWCVYSKVCSQFKRTSLQRSHWHRSLHKK
jgi:hypothetical protein